MIETFDGITPRIAASAFVHPLALVRGDVQIGELCVVHPGAVINADWAAIRIGDHVMVEDNCVLHAGLPEDWRREVGMPLTIGDDVIIGHGAVVHGTRIGNHVLIGMNATVLQNVEIADRCVIAAGAVVPEGEQIPAGSFVAGVPGKIKGKVSKDQSVWTGMSINKAEGLPVLVEYIRKLRDACIPS